MAVLCVLVCVCGGGGGGRGGYVLSHIPSSCIVQAGCVLVSGIPPSRT